MKKYKIRFSKESAGKLYSTIIEANSEKEAFFLAVKEAESKGIKIPNEVWASTTEIK